MAITTLSSGAGARSGSKVLEAEALNVASQSVLFSPCLHSPSQPTNGNGDLSSGGRDFPGGPVVKTSPSIAGGAGSILGQEAKIPHALGPQIQKRTEVIL